MKILVIDNTPLFRQVISQVFASAGLETLSAETGAEAMKSLASGEFDLVCCSYYLADTTGIELCRRLRAMPFGRYLPFILFTSEQVPTVLRNAYAAGVTDIFEKQSLDRLLTFIQRLLAQRDPIRGNVLVVEDSPSMAHLYATLLEKFGLTVAVVEQGETALAAVAGHDFDMVLTDIVLSGPMSGVTLVNQIRRISGMRGEVPILAITAFDDPARRVELFRLGINDYVIKPVASEELAARTRNLIAHFRLLRDTQAARDSAEAEREVAHTALAYRASHDLLTGLANRWAFEQHLAGLLASAETSALHGLALLEITALRAVNDGAGHEGGDALVREIGQRIRGAIPADAFAARLEGSRLAVILRSGSAGTVGSAMAQLLQAVTATDFAWREHRYPVTALAGGIASLHGIENIGTALSRAETAIAASQATGAGGPLVYDESDGRITSRHREKSALPPLLTALNAQAFALFLQPIVPLAEGTAGGHEFLCRMVGSDGALLLPAEFMPTAEQYQLMPRLDRLVTHMALGWIARRGSAGGDTGFFTINLSGQTLSDASFADFVSEELARTKAPADRIYFEITETAVMANADAASAFMQRMRGLGVRFALDDFGSGTATYAQLKHLPVQMLKIDGQFVRGMTSNPVDLAIIRSTCEIARVMKLLTVAEFVETDDEAEMLRSLGIDYGQGFALGRPAPVQEALPDA